MLPMRNINLGPQVFQKPVIQELYQGRSAIESTLDYRIPPQMCASGAASRFFGRLWRGLDVSVVCRLF